uniref:G-protein coupled receptors family 1 profile domain-containing protein n=1 Tax=Sphenodon punctatus TaxID=8508 RepID=A0A8D0GDD0_SPHPU
MTTRNQTMVMEFILIGFYNFLDLQTMLFGVFSIMYMVTLVANIMLIIIIIIIRINHSLPMYFFLSVLSFSETYYIFVVVPNMLANLLNEEGTIFSTGCAIQMFFFIALGGTNCMLLAVMGYYRYVAICKPLHYQVLMNQRICNQLVVFSSITRFILSLIDTHFIFRLPFCGPRKINHYFCDMSPVIKLTCTENNVIGTVIFIFCIVVVFGPFLLILLSYVFILNTILKIPSAEGKHKAFSTCVFHLIVVVMHFGCASIVYLRPNSTYSLDQDTLISVIYTVVTPLLNPMVYSLRNKDLQVALRKALGRKIFRSRQHSSMAGT